MTITERERKAACAEFGATTVVDSDERGIACWTADEPDRDRYGVIVSQAMGRSNLPGVQSAERLIEDWRPEVLVVVGTAGALAERKGQALTGPKTGDVVCVEYVHYTAYAKYDKGERHQRYYPVQHPDSALLTGEVREVESTNDWHVGLPDKPDGEDPPDVKYGALISLETVAGDGNAAGQQELLAGLDHAIAVDMESGGIARAVSTASDTVYYRPVWLTIRGVSDIVARDGDIEKLLKDNNAERDNWTPYAAAAAARFAHRVIERYLRRARVDFTDDGAPPWLPVARR
jgi:nucleoside phosphorylase